MRKLHMLTATRILTALCALILAVSASASSLTIVPQHAVLVTDDEQRQQLRVLFADEQLSVDITLNVYVLEQLPSTRAYHDELRKLTRENWLAAVDWSLVTTDDVEVALPRATILTSSERERGPQATSEADRDTTVPMSTYKARLAFGPVPTGDYVLRASVRGLTSQFPFVVRTGSEPELRDHYLRLEANRTRDYAEFRRLQLARVQNNPKRIDALYDLIDRALLQGTMDETRSYFDRVITAAETARRTTRDPKTASLIAARLQQLRAARSALPEYFANRKSWMMTRDMKTGDYSIRERANGRVVREFAVRQ